MNDKNLNSEEFKKRHGYIIDGIWYPRVTSIVNIKSKPALYYFYAAAENFNEAQTKKRKAAYEGTIVHEILESIVRGKEIIVPPEFIGFKRGFESFLKNYSLITKADWIEKRIKHSDYRYSGTFDILAEIDGVFSLIDIKTAAEIYDDYRLQTAAYFYALNEEPILLDKNNRKIVLPKYIEKRYILRVNQIQICELCGAKKIIRQMGDKIKGGDDNCHHKFSEITDEWEFKEFDNPEEDFKGFLACKELWEWEYRDKLKELGYI
ncbi:MAG: hypothetical protein KatS3mg095_0143 [Candidatus Parcubacteria bacterium]|nr:MAG: hypothetical protein KatS3mg095_0143 [Candidatus Parcubacteria bacterium]